MADNAQKTPLARTLNQVAVKAALNQIQQIGKALPASVVSVSGSIVTVKFEVQSSFTLPNVTIPMAGPEYIRFPTQVGDKGIVLPADVSLGGISGLGMGTAALALQANLSALVFLPIANKNWSPSENPNAIVLYGPDGGILRTSDSLGMVKVSALGTDITVPLGKTLSIHSLPISPAGLLPGGLWRSGTQVQVVP